MTRLAYDPEHAIVTVHPDILPEGDDFELWARLFLHFPAFERQEFEQGADRHLMRFHYRGERFNLHFEHYSESLWITAEGVEAEKFLPEIVEYVTTNLIP